MMDWNDDGAWMSGWGMLFMFLIWFAILGLIIWALIRTTNAKPTDARLESPRQILDRRLAVGELTPGEHSAAAEQLAHSERGSGTPPG